MFVLVPDVGWVVRVQVVLKVSVRFLCPFVTHSLHQKGLAVGSYSGDLILMFRAVYVSLLGSGGLPVGERDTQSHG